MWLIDKGAETPDTGAAYGSRAVLILAICFLGLCVFQAVAKIARCADIEGSLRQVQVETDAP